MKINSATRPVFLSSALLFASAFVFAACNSQEKFGNVFLNPTRQSELNANSRPSTLQPFGSNGQNDPLSAFSDAETFSYLTDSCGSCHGPDGAYKANWEMPAKENLTVQSIEGIPGIVRAYQAVYNKYLGNEGASPSAMPLNIDFNNDPKSKSDAERFIKWFAARLPTVVQDAKSLYPHDEKSGTAAVTTSEVKVQLNYQCKQQRTGKSYLTKLTQTLFNRDPTDEEKKLIQDKEQVALSHEHRKLLASRIKTDAATRVEFENVGLKNFARKIADASKIMPADIDPAANREAIKNDLQEEFYQLLKKYYQTKSYREILLLDKVMVTQRTAGLYAGCTAPSAPAVWAECTLTPDRSNFFGTVGFLRAKPSSFLENGNNYGRAGAMFVVASGEALLPQTNGPAGDTVKALPKCLTDSTKDSRARIKPNFKAGTEEPLSGPFGSLTVPGFGNVCQGCHVRRGLAAGSKIYRPFGKFGEILSASIITGACGPNPTTANPCPTRLNNVYNNDVREAVKEDKAYYENGQLRFASDAVSGKARDANLDKTQPVTVAFLTSLLQEPPGTCIPVDSKTEKTVSTIKDMAEFVVGSEANVARGLARLIPKAIAGTNLLNQEIIMAVSKASSEKVLLTEVLGNPSDSQMKSGMFAEMLIAYLSTESFGCQEEGND